MVHVLFQSNDFRIVLVLKFSETSFQYILDSKI